MDSPGNTDIESVVSNPTQEVLASLSDDVSTDSTSIVDSDVQKRRCLVISLIRHAQCTGNAHMRWLQDDEPDPLTELGRRQADSLGKKWTDTRIDGLLSSPYLRAHDTAKALSDHNKSNPTISIRGLLIERKYGRTVPEKMRVSRQLGQEVLTGQWSYSTAPPSRTYRPPQGGESMEDVASRAELIIRSILTQYGVTQSEAPEFFLNKKTTDEPDVLPDGIPHVVIVSHNVFLMEFYEKLKSWGGEWQETNCDYRNADWSRHILWYDESSDKLDFFDMRYCSENMYYW